MPMPEQGISSALNVAWVAAVVDIVSWTTVLV
jgi:hypothetical protein